MNHLPIMRAKALYRGGPRSFEADLGAHLQRGFVWSSDTEFIMARLVSSKLIGHWNDLDYAAVRETADTWMIWMAVGMGLRSALARFLELMPFRQEFLAWHRRGNRLRIWRLEDFERHVKANRKDVYGWNHS